MNQLVTQPVVAGLHWTPWWSEHPEPQSRPSPSAGGLCGQQSENFAGDSDAELEWWTTILGARCVSENPEPRMVLPGCLPGR